MQIQSAKLAEKQKKNLTNLATNRKRPSTMLEIYAKSGGESFQEYI